MTLQMTVKNYSLASGIFFLVMGALATIPAFSGLTFGLPILQIEASYGYFLGLFPWNILNKILLIALGIWGIVSANDPVLFQSRTALYVRSVFYIMFILAVMGVFTQTNTLFGYMPLFGATAWFHFTLAFVSGVFSYSSISKKTSLPH